MGQPGNRVALAGPRRVLDQVTLTGAVLPAVGHDPANTVELMVSWEDQRQFAGLLSLVVLLFDYLDEVLDQVQHAVLAPGLFPEIGGGEAQGRGRIPGPAVATLVVRQEAGLGPLQVRRHVHQVGIDGEVGQAPAKREQRFTRVTVGAVLADGVFDGLASERVLEFRRDDGDAV